MKKLLVFLLALAAVSCVGEKRVVIVSTNDIHSAIDNFPRLATLVDSLRGTGDEIFLVDAGDRWTGDPFVDLAERPLYPIVELMNTLGYDLAVPGNHEFDWGQELLRERTLEMNFPVIAANVTGLDFVKPYEIVERGGVRMAFLGLVPNFTPDRRPEGKAEHFEGLTFPDVFETVERYVTLKDSADVFIALTHIGHGHDLELAERVPSLDLIIGGDSHTVVSEPEHVGKTLITQTGSKLTYAGVTVVTKRGRELAIENRLVPLDGIATSPKYSEIVDRIKNNPALTSPLGETAAPFNEDGVDNLVADAIRAYTFSDAAFYHSGGVRLDTLAGGISTADLFRIDPFLSEIYTLKMTAGQIKGMIVATFNSEGKEGGGPDIIPSGLTYAIETDASGEAVGVVLSPEKALYTVAVPDYLFKNYTLSYTGGVTRTGYLVTSILQSYIDKRSPLKPENISRIEIK